MKIKVDVTEKLNGSIPKSCKECIFATPIEQLDLNVCEGCDYWPCGKSCVWCELEDYDINDKERACYVLGHYDKNETIPYITERYYDYEKPRWCPLKMVD